MSEPLDPEGALRSGWTIPIMAQPEFAIDIARPDGSRVVGIRYDGTVAFGEGISPDAAAVEFYTRLAHMIQVGRSPAAQE